MSAEKSLYERLGGAKGITGIIDELKDEILSIMWSMRKEIVHV